MNVSTRQCATCGGHFRPTDSSHVHCTVCVRGHVQVTAVRIANLAAQVSDILPSTEICALAASIVQVTSPSASYAARPEPSYPKDRNEAEKRPRAIARH